MSRDTKNQCMGTSKRDLRLITWFNYVLIEAIPGMFAVCET